MISRGISKLGGKRGREREEEGGRGRKREEERKIEGGRGRKREEEGGRGRKREEEGGRGRKREGYLDVLLQSKSSLDLVVLIGNKRGIICI